jgi:putative Mg2+ transporter-C (MgtC) family protein
VRGTATAASLWATGAIGAAAAYERWAVVVSVSAVVFLTLRLLTPIESKIKDEDNDTGKDSDDDADEDEQPPSKGLESRG